MLRQYFQLSEDHPGVIIAIRVGDFFEFYGPDAETVAKELEITLTGREDGPNGRIPMAGVPHHSVERYLARLLAKGYKVALCDQLEDPKLAKGLVKRGITRILTPGTVMEESMLPGKANNYLCGFVRREGISALATLDSSTGELAVSQWGESTLEGRGQDLIISELSRLNPAEIVLDEQSLECIEPLKEAFGFSITKRSAPRLERAQRMLQDHYQVTQLDGFGLDGRDPSVIAIGLLFDYCQSVQIDLSHLIPPATYDLSEFMRIDPSTRRGLELTENMAVRGKNLTLLQVLDESITPMGSRLMRKWIEQPLLDVFQIESRLDAVERLTRHGDVRADLASLLNQVKDIERLTARCANSIAVPRDLKALQHSLEALPMIDRTLQLVAIGRIQELRTKLHLHLELVDELKKSLVDEPPATLKEGNVIRRGFDHELDELRKLTTDGRTYIAELETAERKKTGISSLKVGFNSVFGYYIELPKSQISKAPADYIRKQTTANAERYITAELKDHESVVLGARDKSIQLETDLFNRIRATVAGHAAQLVETSRSLAEIDVLAGFATVAIHRHYIRPKITDQDVIFIEEGRHPVVECSREDFVPNSLSMGIEEERLHVVTGPNMAGKSTFLRQNALIVLMAQIGSFVPATSCTIGLCDRIFARIGARDELALGQSTFMVEMLESANILNNATPQSLVILDEVGRGTSTFDGLAIAWAMIEHLIALQSKTLFATHYHQLNGLADQSTGVVNYRVAVEEIGDSIVWTHRVMKGGADRSYGIHVARMAGIPGTVLTRATHLLAGFEGDRPPSVDVPPPARVQLQLFELEEPLVMRELRSVDVNQLTPLSALQLIDSLKRQLDS